MITFNKGPLGWGVTQDGRIIGMIRKTRDGYLVAIEGFKPGDGRPSSSHLFKTLAAAKRACNLLLPDHNKQQTTEKDRLK
jgi:hypothetical protein